MPPETPARRGVPRARRAPRCRACGWDYQARNLRALAGRPFHRAPRRRPSRTVPAAGKRRPPRPARGSSSCCARVRGFPQGGTAPTPPEKDPAREPRNSKISDARRSAPTGSCAEQELANGQAHLLEGLQVRVAALGHGALKSANQVELTQWLVGRAMEHDLEGGR